MHGQTTTKYWKFVTVNTHIQSEGIYLLFVLFKRECVATTKENICDEGMWPLYVKAKKGYRPVTFTIFLFSVAYRLDVRDARSWGAYYPFTLVFLVINVGPVSAYCKLFPHRLLWVRNIVPDRKPLESNRKKTPTNCSRFENVRLIFIMRINRFIYRI